MKAHGVRKLVANNGRSAWTAAGDYPPAGVAAKAESIRVSQVRAGEKQGRESDTAEKGTAPRLLVRTRCAGCCSSPILRVSHSRQESCSRLYARWLASSARGSSGICSVAHIWPWGWGLLAPIMAPRFSKICTCRISGRAPSSNTPPSRRPLRGDVGHSMRARVRLWSGWKHKTRQTPRSLSAAATRGPSPRPRGRVRQQRGVVVHERKTRCIAGYAGHRRAGCRGKDSSPGRNARAAWYPSG